MDRRAFFGVLAAAPLVAHIQPDTTEATILQRIRELVAVERRKFQYLGAIPGNYSRCFWVRDDCDPGWTSGYQSEAAARESIENSIARRVLNTLGITGVMRGEFPLWFERLPAEELILRILTLRSWFGLGFRPADGYTTKYGPKKRII